MKRLKIAGIISVMLIFALFSLGSGSSDDSEKKKITTQDTAATTDGSSSEGASEKSEAPAEQSKGTDITIQEEVVIDEPDIKVTAKEYVTDSIWGDGIKFLVENNGSSDIGLGCTALIVNDYMITDLFSSTVAAGKKSNETMYLSSSQLKAAGIDNVGQIEVYFHTYDADEYSTIKDYPCITIKTSAFENMDKKANDDGTELYNDNGIRIVGKYVDEDSFWGAAVLLYIENNSGKNVVISCDDLSINGFMMTPYFSATVYDGKKSIDDITLLSTQLEENGITSIDDIELKFRIYDEKSFSTITETDVISFSAK